MGGLNLSLYKSKGCLSVVYDLANSWTDMVLLYSTALYTGSGEGLEGRCISTLQRKMRPGKVWRNGIFYFFYN